MTVPLLHERHRNQLKPSSLSGSLPQASLWHIMMDPSQIERILVNLCISERGEGTTLKICFARYIDPVVDTPSESGGEFPQSRGETMLVVEDEVSLLKLASGILARLGYTVLIVGTPGEALHLVEEYTGSHGAIFVGLVKT